jgi:hypothetical protein
LIVTSAAVGLLIVGVLAVALTRAPLDNPSAVESTATPLRGDPVALAPDLATTAVMSLASAPAGSTSHSPMAVVTPVGDDGFGVTTLEAVAGKGSTLTAQLPTGTAVRIVVVGTDERSGLALVALPDAVGNAGGGFRMADEQVDPDDTVVVHGVETTVVAVVELAHLKFAEGTPVLDDEGELVGLCSGERNGTRLVPVAGDHEPGPTTPSSAVPASTPMEETTVASSAPTDDSPTSTEPGSESTGVSSSVASTEAGD